MIIDKIKKSLAGGWVDGWVSGSKREFKDCFEQSKKLLKDIELFLLKNETIRFPGMSRFEMDIIFPDPKMSLFQMSFVPKTTFA